jgi:hypothetical protein
MRNGTCALCGHHEVVEAAVEDYARHIRLALILGFDATRKWQDREGAVFWGGRRSFDRPAPVLPPVYGTLLLYICRSCGFSQCFATAPDQIPIGEEFRTRLVSRPTEGPYR